MLKGLSNISGSVDGAFLVIIGISLVMLVGITAVMVFFIFRYGKKRHPNSEEIEGNLALELTWTILPTILVLLMFWVGYKGFVLMRTTPKNAMLVKVTARSWSWLFEYENGKKDRELVIPVDKPIRLAMTSEDVLHSLFIPAFRVKEDIVPGQETTLWFIPNVPGEYDLFCTEYCGVGHSSMLTKVKVLTSDDFDTWYASDQTGGAEEMHPGEKLVREKGCIGCHSTDGAKLVGPSFKDIMGRKVTVITGGNERVITADAEYIEHSIEEPGKDIVKGFPPVMPTIPLTEEEVGDIIDYLSILSGKLPVRHEEIEGEEHEEKAHEEREKVKVEQSKQPNTDLNGRTVLQEKGCLSCHSTDGSRLIGPSLKGIMGRETTVLTDGQERTITADADYIARSIRQPNADVVNGYQAMMPPLPLSDKEIDAVITYLETLE